MRKEDSEFHEMTKWGGVSSHNIINLARLPNSQFYQLYNNSQIIHETALLELEIDMMY